MEPTTTQQDPYVFISYSSTNRALVLPIIGKLQEAGARVWVDIANIPPGGNYGLEIAKGIQGSSLVVLAITEAALESRNVKQEIQLAWKHRRPYLPLLLEPVEIPPEIEYWLEGYQWVQVHDRSEEQWLPPVIQALDEAGIRVISPRSRVVLRTPTTPLTVVAPIVSTQTRAVVAPAPATPTPSQISPAVAVAAGLKAQGSRDPSRFLLAAMAGAGALVMTFALILVLALARGDSSRSATPPADPNLGSVGVSQPAASEASTAGARPAPDAPGGTARAAGLPVPAPAPASNEQTQPARIMPMGS